MKTSFTAGGGLLLTGLLFMSSCSRTNPSELVQATEVVHGMMKSSHLSRSCFSAAFPDGKPSQFVSYLFSDMGVAEWPPSEGSAESMEQEQMQAVRMPLCPKDVAIISRQPDPTRQKQVVIKFDDGRNLVIVEAYLSPKEPPAFSRQWELPRVKPAAGIEGLYRSNAGMGMSSQSF